MKKEIAQRLGSLEREFDARGSTVSMRKEARKLARLAKAPRPRWLPTDDWS